MKTGRSHYLLCLFSTRGFFSKKHKKSVRRLWRGGAAQLEHDPANSRIWLETVPGGSGELLLWQRLGRGTKGNPACEMTENGVHGLHGLCCCSGMCCWVGSTHTGTRMSACKEMLAWDWFIAILLDLITCDSLMFHNSVQPGFLCMRIFWRAWTMARARYIHLEPLNNAGSKQSMWFTGSVPITCSVSA